MRAGDLRQRVTINSKTAISQDSFGAEQITWIEFAIVWAAVEPLTGREFMDARQITAEVTTRVRIRKLEGVIPTMQVVFGSKVYDVLAVLHVEERKREMQLMCQEII